MTTKTKKATKKTAPPKKKKVRSPLLVSPNREKTEKHAKALMAEGRFSEARRAYLMLFAEYRADYEDLIAFGYVADAGSVATFGRVGLLEPLKIDSLCTQLVCLKNADCRTDLSMAIWVELLSCAMTTVREIRAQSARSGASAATHKSRVERRVAATLAEFLVLTEKLPKDGLQDVCRELVRVAAKLARRKRLPGVTSTSGVADMINALSLATGGVPGEWRVGSTIRGKAMQATMRGYRDGAVARRPTLSVSEQRRRVGRSK